MKPNAKLREVGTSGVTATGDFGISRTDEAHIMGILRDTLYSDKVLAVLREYSANAWDANRVVGKEDVPIKVTLPTDMDPTLRIRDFGPGLSQDDVFTVYTQYGASTKRTDNNSVGMLGIGSKSGFAYSDSFTITSWNDGWKRTYVAVLDESEKGKMNLLYEEACDYEETGVEILLAIKTEDIQEFHEKAEKLFKHFVPLPEINIELPKVTEEQTVTTEGVLWRESWNNNEWTAVMGCVPYVVDIDEIIDREIDGEKAGEYLKRLSGILYFDIGGVEISASRERLKYSSKTRLALIRKFNHVVDEYVRITFDKIKNGGFSLWERRVRAQILNELKLPVPPELADAVKDVVSIEEPLTFSLGQVDETKHTLSIMITDETRLLRRDDHRQYAGYKLKQYDYIVRPVGTSTWAEVNTELDALLAKAELTGLPIADLSSLPWEMPRKPGWKPPKKKNAKHKVRTFALSPGRSFCIPFSDCWKIEDRAPTDDDVFIVMRNFKADGYDFYSKYNEDREFSKLYGDGKMPTIYGYKSTEKKPVVVADCKGTEYRTWRREFVKSLITPEVQKKLDKWEWSRHLEDYNRRNKELSTIVELFGKKHPLTGFMGRQFAAKKAISRLKLDYEKRQSLIRLYNRINPDTEKTQFAIAQKEFYDRYPLLKAVDGLDVLWGSHGPQWAEYIHLIDRTIPVTTPQEPAEQEEQIS